ncbi:response regulator [Planomonospora venezuelensis]|uniref:CheY-like chemotaxis protein n=1 Tax=Planomonospora venezuelensis TaxID=1999 RepID=A0A841CYI0_PLAVE|nr:response regulator [Planomonospora venezuelensis]MBB5961047.1 CheY-like chemotaxis protein [Planomonospora venezuelensis]GIN01331.1 response regulator [Planomonospora venezuelensis]
MPDRAKILLVDDREENLIALEAILSSLDLVPVRARSGEEALKALLSSDFALILLDVRMPGMDGFETASHIKRRERTRNIPIIFLTVVDSAPDYAFRSYAAGAVDYLTKPFDPWVLRAKVSVFVELYNMNRRLSEQASLLRERLAAELPPGRSGDQAAVLPELSSRLTAVENELTRVRELARKTGDPSITGPLSDLTDRVNHLRSGFDALT